MNTQSSSLMINVATVNTKGISEDLSLIVKCCQIMVSEMMCQLLKLNNPCWSAVSDYNADQRRGLIGTRKPRLGGYETDNLHGSGVVDQMLEPWLGVLTAPPQPQELRGPADPPGGTCLDAGMVGKGSMGLWSVGTCLSQEAGCGSQPGTSLFWQERAWGSQAGIRSPSSLSGGANHSAAARSAISRPPLLH